MSKPSIRLVELGIENQVIFEEAEKHPLPLPVQVLLRQARQNHREMCMIIEFPNGRANNIIQFPGRSKPLRAA